MSRVKSLLPNQPVTTTGLRPSRELLEALQIIDREALSAEWGSISGTLGNQVDLQTELNDLQVGINGKAATVHTHVSTAITDSTVAGRAMLTAVDAAAQSALLNSAPVTVTADFTLGAGSWVINAKAGSDCVVTLPAASAGRSVTLKTVVGFAIVSAAADVVPLAGGVAGTAIVGNVAGQWATIVYDGTLWQIMAGA